MFIHNLKYSLLTLFKNKMLIFWTFAFPIILGTFFNMAFSGIEDSEKLDIINIAIVENEAFMNNQAFKESFKALSDEKNDQRLFNTQYVSEDEAKKLLKDDEITGYLILTDTPKIVVNSSGINETIFKFVTEEISQSEDIAKNISEKRIQEILMENPEKASELDKIYADIYQEVMKMTQKDDVSIKNISASNLSYTMIEYYSLMAMACLYGGILGMVAINQNLANMSSNGKRVAVSPASKSKIIFSSVLASYIAQMVGVALLFVYTLFVLKVDYGNNLLPVILLAMVGSLAGLCMGVTIATLLKANENVKTGVLISITLLCCFLSGMMGITMKYVVDKNVPIINKINPASMITDGFYSLYYYETLDRYWFNVISLLIFAFVMIAVSMVSLRRQKYDSI